MEKPGSVSDYGPPVGEGISSTAGVGRLQTRQRGGWRRARTRVLAGDDLVDGAAVIDDVEFAGLVFPEGTDPQVGRQQGLHHPAAAAFTQRPQCTAAVIAEDVAPDQGADACAAVDGAPGDRTASFASVLADGQDEACPVAGGGRIEAVRALHGPPAVVSTLLYQVDLLPLVLTHVGEKEPAARPVEGEAPGIAQTVGPDLATRSCPADEGVVRRDAVGRIAVDVDAQQLAEQGIEPLPVVLRIARGAAVPHPDVEHPVRAEEVQPAVV